MNSKLKTPLPPEVLAALARGNMVEAIRLLRQTTGLGLKEAKDALDEAEHPGSTIHQHLAPGEVPRSMGAQLGWWLVAAAVLFAAYSYYLAPWP